MIDTKYSKRNKYGNKVTQIDGITFDSMKEARRYQELKLLEKAGALSDLKLQERFEIIPKNGKERAAYYYADFTYIENGVKIIEDVKSPATKKEKTYVLKRKLVKWRYKDIEFREV